MTKRWKKKIEIKETKEKTDIQQKERKKREARSNQKKKRESERNQDGGHLIFGKTHPIVPFQTHHHSRPGEPSGTMRLKRELTKGHSVHFVDSRGQELLSAKTPRADESPDASDPEEAQEKGRGRRNGTGSSSTYPSRSPTKGKRGQTEVQGAWEQADTPPGESGVEGHEKLFVRRRSMESFESEKDRNSAESSRREGWVKAIPLTWDRPTSSVIC